MNTKKIKYDDMPVNIPLRVAGRPLRLFVEFGDIICIVTAGLIAFHLKFNFEGINTTYQLVILLGGIVFGLISSHTYHLLRNISFSEKIIRVWISWFFSLLILVSGVYLLKAGNLVSREFIITWYLLGSTLILFNRVVLFKVLNYFFKLSFTSKNIVLIGEGLLADELFTRFSSSNINEYKLKEVITLKDLDKIDALLTRSDISEIWVSSSLSSNNYVEKINMLLDKLHHSF